MEHGHKEFLKRVVNVYKRRPDRGPQSITQIEGRALEFCSIGSHHEGHVVLSMTIASNWPVVTTTKMKSGKRNVMPIGYYC